MTEVPELCRQLAVLRRALAAAATPGRQDDDRSHPHRTADEHGADEARLATGLIAATLAPTAPPAGGRRPPGSRSPIADELLDAALDLDHTVIDAARALRRTLNHSRRDLKPAAALAVIPALWNALPDPDVPPAVVSRIPAVLAATVGRTRRILDIDERWLTLGACPEIHQQPITVAWGASGVDGDGVAFVEVHECVTYDALASLKATAARRRQWERDVRVWAGPWPPPVALAPGPVDIWRRSHLRVRRDVDLRTATVTCEGCGRPFLSAERNKLAQLVERQAVDALAQSRTAPA